VPDVIIRRCVMRVVRRGGWSWGREPRRLVDDVVRALPALVAAELERLLPETAEGEIAAPLRVDIKASLAELRRWARSAALANGAGVDDTAAGARASAAPPTDHPEIARAIRQALAAVHLADRIAVAAPPGAVPEAAVLEPDPDERAAVLLNLLMAWRSADGLESLLRTLPDAAVQAWHRVLLERRVASRPAGDDPILAEAQQLLAQLAAPAHEASHADRLRLRLQAAVALAVEAGAHLARPAVRAAIDAAIAVPAPATAARVAVRTNPPAASLRAGNGFESRVSSALPFLLLGTLHRIGWLNLLDATMAGAHLEERLPALAIALATKVLPEPERGWRRTPHAMRAASTFAGDAESRPDDEVASLAHAAAPLMPALDAVVRRSLIDGRRAGTPVLVCSAGGVRLVVDPPGVFLIAHADAHEALAAHLVDTGAPVFIPEDEAAADLLLALDAAGVRFATPARPVREERWTAMPGTRAPRLFSNRPTPPLTPPRAIVAARARDTWSALMRRPLPGRPADPALDRSVSLAAAVALGTLAWELWRGREPTDPLLALERFGDLEGTVRFDAQQVRVRLPLGKRFRDLKEAGLLADVPRLPWLGFRSVVFAGG
jgi:hypothetical protein